MGRHCGFQLLKLIDGKLTPYKIIPDSYEENGLTSYMWVDGRCEATDIFINAIRDKESPNKYRWSLDRKLLPEESYTAYLLLNHKELDNFNERRESETEWYNRYFFIGLNEFEDLFDFNKVHEEQQESINRYKTDIDTTEKEIDKLREYQLKAKTEVAFKGFQKEIDSNKKRIDDCKEMIEYLTHDDYDYNHYLYIEDYLNQIKDIIEKDPDIVVIAFGSD